MATTTAASSAASAASTVAATTNAVTNAATTIATTAGSSVSGWYIDWLNFDPLRDQFTIGFLIILAVFVGAILIMFTICFIYTFFGCCASCCKCCCCCCKGGKKRKHGSKVDVEMDNV